MKKAIFIACFLLLSTSLAAETPENLIEKLSRHEAVIATFSCRYVRTMSTSLAVKDTFMENGFLLKKGPIFAKDILEPEQMVIPIKPEDYDRNEVIDIFLQSYKLKQYRKFILKETDTDFVIVGYKPGKKIECLMDKQTSRPTQITIFLDNERFAVIKYIYTTINGITYPKRANFHYYLANNHDMDINVEYLGFYSGYIPANRDVLK